MKEKVNCVYCNGLGKIEACNNGPIAECPICYGAGYYFVIPKLVVTSKCMED